MNRHKKRYQYLKYFNHPKQVGPYNSEAEVHTISQVENPMSVPVGLPMGVPPGSNNGNIPPGLGMNEDSNHSGKDLPGAGSNVELAFRYCIYNFSITMFLEKYHKAQYLLDKMFMIM